MRLPDALELLTIWENRDAPLFQKTVNLLSIACPEMDTDSAAKLSIGERDGMLLLLRELLFGQQLINMADCPECAMRIEWITDIREIRRRSIQPENTEKAFSLKADEFSIRFRLPNSFDLLSVFASSTKRPVTPVSLLASCVLETRCKGDICDLHELPDTVLQALNRRMEEMDPQADIRMNLTCPDCLHQWEVQFDIESYLWTEIDWWAKRLLREVHILASAYGWSEHDILNLSPIRRQAYLDLA